MKLFFLAVAAFFSFSLSAGQYVGVSGGTNQMIVTTPHAPGVETGYHGLFKYGYGFESSARVEAELCYRHGRFKTVELETSKVFAKIYSLSYMVNALYDINQLNTYSVTPYVGLGLGYCQTTDHVKVRGATSTVTKERDDRIAYQAIAGLSYPVNDTVKAGLEYKYFAGRSHQKDHTVGMVLTKSF